MPAELLPSRLRAPLPAALLFMLLFCCACAAPREAETVLEVTPAPTEVVVKPDPTPTPSPTPEQPLLSFAIAGDSRGLYADEEGRFHGALGGVNTEVVGELLASVKASGLNPEFMVTLGDYAMGAKDADEMTAQYQTFLAAVQEYYPGGFLYPCYGNHEAKAGEAGIALFSEAFSEFSADEFFDGETYGRTVYLVRRGGCNFFVLNTNAPGTQHRVTGDVLDWVRARAGEGGDYNFIFVHEPAFPSGSHADDSMDVFPKARDEFWQTVESLKNAAVFNAHEHQYARRLVDASFSEEGLFSGGVYQITTAGMGAPFHFALTDTRGMLVRPVLVFHYLAVRIYEDRAEFAAVALSGREFDHFTLYADGRKDVS